MMIAAVLQQIFLGNLCNARMWQKTLRITCHLHNKFQNTGYPLFVRVDVSNGCMIKKLSWNIGASVIKRSRPSIMDKSLGTLLHFFGIFQFTHAQPLTSTHILDMCSQFQICIGWGEGELQENFENDALFYKGTHKLQKIMNTALLSQCKFFSP